MKLEAGKNYVLRNGEVVHCERIWEEQCCGYQASVILNEPNYPHAYALNIRKRYGLHNGKWVKLWVLQVAICMKNSAARSAKINSEK